MCTCLPVCQGKETNLTKSWFYQRTGGQGPLLKTISLVVLNSDDGI